MARRQFQARAPRRRMTWEGNALSISNLFAGTPQTLTLLSEAVLENFPLPTIIRVRGRIGVYADTAVAADTVFTVIMGIMVVPTSTIATSPTPLTDIGSDWLWWDAATVRAATGSELDTTTVDRIVVDNKAMRKVGNNESVIFTAEMVNCEGTGQANVCGTLRVLLKAP